MTKLRPFKTIGPGDVIKDEMEFYGWSQKDLAEILDISEKHVSQLLNNKISISTNLALLLSATFEQSHEFWINLDANYKKQQEMSEQCHETELRAKIFQYMPVRDMQKKGWLPKKKDQLLKTVKKFWGIDELDFSFLEKRVNKACFKKSEAFSSKFNAYFAQTWLRKVKLEASKVTDIPKYSKTRLLKLSEQIPYFSTLENGIKEFVRELKSVGVNFLIISHLEKTYTDGAAYWVNENPVIALTGRYKRNDNFWFTLAHEIGHLIHHSQRIKSSGFIDSMDNTDLLDRPQEEKEANEFAGMKLLYPQIHHHFKGLARISRLRVEECSQKLGIHTGIIVGYLQRNEMLSYRNLNHLKKNIEDILKELQNTAY
jgi:HTH-type transcriptional regulator/antitoxin HigA